MPRRAPTAVGLIRPVGVAPGGIAVVAAWVAAYVVARLTGAVSVTVVLAALVVGALGAVPAGWRRLRRAHTVDVTSMHGIAAGESVTIVAVIDPRVGSAHVCLVDRGAKVASGWATTGRLVAEGHFDQRGIIDEIEVRVRSAGSPGLVWWERRLRVVIDELVIAPCPAGPGADVEIAGDGGVTNSSGGRAGHGDDDVDGIRPWRDGDSERSVHWASSLRSGTLVVHDLHSAAPTRWIVRSDPSAPEPDVEAGRCRWALDEARRRGAQPLAAIGSGDTVAIADAEAAARWSSTCVPQPARAPERLARRPGEPDSTLSPAARWSTAAASGVASAMLVGALDTSLIGMVLVLAGTLGGAAVTASLLRRALPVPQLWRHLVSMASLVVLVGIMLAGGGLTDLLTLLRGPLPQLLMLLVVLHGFECVDRRTARAHVAISVVVATYASGLRVDGRLGLWLAAWFALAVAAFVAIARPASPIGDQARLPAGARPHRRALGALASVGLGVAATVMLLSLVSVPAGPAALTLPTFIDDVRRTPVPGTLTRPDGTPTQRGDTGDGSRGAVGTGGNGGYPGFAESLDTSIRGPLSDEVVMRVRAPEPEFWRGQTFAEFDGRFWYADADLGWPGNGPSIEVAPADGDIARPTSGVATSRFVQTYFVEVDQPNIVFAAYRPTEVILDGMVWRRPDGALRSDVLLTKGSVYTVVSARAEITATSLREQGDVATRLQRSAELRLDRYLVVPPTITDRTTALADELHVDGASTYDTVRAIEAWLATNVEYDLDAPVPAEGVDAVDDFLFESQRGFCEQIATALTMLLRTQGVPARLVTGYVPGERDRISGVWKVRGSDAHAWVEVWFPQSGWQAFDPTAEVPLAGETQRSTVGGDLARALGGALRAHAVHLAELAIGALVLTVGIRGGRSWRRRRRRGRWGVIQDRWQRAAAARGLDTMCSNPELARRWASSQPRRAGHRRSGPGRADPGRAGPDSSDEALRLAAVLDRVAFDPEWIDSDEIYDEAAGLSVRLGV